MGMKWLLNYICTKYGTVTEGKHKGCGMGVGSDDNGVKSMNGVVWTKLMFIKGTKMIEEVRIESLKSYKIISKTAKATVILITYADGEQSRVYLPAVDGNGQPWSSDRVGLVLGALSSVPVEE